MDCTPCVRQNIHGQLVCDGNWLLFFTRPIAVTTPSHGTAFDIVGTGQAKMEAMTNAFRLACRMGLAGR